MLIFNIKLICGPSICVYIKIFMVILYELCIYMLMGLPKRTLNLKMCVDYILLSRGMSILNS